MKKNNSALPIFLAFLCMGFGDLGGPLKGLFVDTFGLSNTEATLSTTVLSFGMFGLLSIPTGVLQYKIGKFAVLTIGLFTCVLGMIFPLFELSLATAIISLLLMGAGATMLQVAGSPVMKDLSAEGKFPRNLSIAQGFKSVGTLSTALIPLLAAMAVKGKLTGWLNQSNSWRIMFPIFGVVLLVTGIWFAFLGKNEKKSSQQPTTFKSCFKALSDPFIAIMTLMIFIYVGIEVCLFSNASTYLKDIVLVGKVTKFDISLLATAVAMGSLIVGRLIGGAILDKANPKKLFVASTVLAIVGFSLFFIPAHEAVAWIALVVSGLGLANLYPLIFSITMDDRPSKSNEISGLMTTAILGGAIVPLAMSAIADACQTPKMYMDKLLLKPGVLIGFSWPLALLCVILVVSIVVLLKAKKRK